MCQSVLVIGGFKRTQIVISGHRRTADKNYAAAIVRIVKIWVVPAVPHKVAVVRHIGVAESEAHTEAGAVEGAIA